MLKRIVMLLSAVILILAISGCYSEDDLTAAKAEGYEAGYRAGYEAGYNALKPIDRPESGEILFGKEYDEAQLKVLAATGCDYVVSLKDMLGQQYISFYVRAGDTVTVGVPANFLYVYFASGNEWFGYGQGLMFGEDTYYTKDDEVLDFTEYNWEYSLEPVYDGNFSETPSNENEFF